MTCKCGARTYEGHLKKTQAGYPGHTYRGTVWLPPQPPRSNGSTERCELPPTPE